jgi:hypothetical protein
MTGFASEGAEDRHSDGGCVVLLCGGCTLETEVGG